MIYRAGVNLTKLSDKKLGEIVAKCLELGADQRDIDLYEKDYVNHRKAVRLAAVAIGMVERIMTKVTVLAPSPESRIWSNLEGGHTFVHRPTDEEVRAALNI